MGNIISIYSGDITNIPKGWHLCDGTNGIPNLEDLFIRGAYSDATRPAMRRFDEKLSHSHSCSNTGSHSHPAMDKSGSHRHETTYSIESYCIFDEIDGDNVRNLSNYARHSHSINSSGGHSHSIGTATAIVPYYTLAYIALEDSKLYDFPTGSILMWNGYISDIPSDYVFCNGENNTPDLRDKFILGANSNIGETTNGTHTHNVSTDGSHEHTTYARSYEHRHTDKIYGDGSFSSGSSFYFDYADDNHSHYSLESSGSHSHQVVDEEIYPAHYTLAYIMKIS